MKKSPQIITFSRRSDCAFYMDWFMRRCEAGFCDIPNPFSGKLYRVSLLPDDVALMTFWTKNPSAVERYIPMLSQRGYKTAFFITMTGYGKHIESAVPEPQMLADSIARCALMLSPDALWWRYDPVIFSRSMDAAYHKEKFEYLCDTIWKKKTRRVIFSLAHIDGPYAAIRKKLSEALSSCGDELMMPPLGSPGHEQLYHDAISLFEELSAIAAQRGIAAEVCCSPRIRPGDEARIRQGSCLSLEYIRRLIPGFPEMKIRGTRKGAAITAAGYAECSCLESRDIGINGTCTHGCVYCYANRKGMDTQGIGYLKKY